MYDVSLIRLNVTGELTTVPSSMSAVVMRGILNVSDELGFEADIRHRVYFIAP